MSTARVIPFAQDSPESTAAVKRYRMAYRVAERATSFAETVRLAGTFIAGAALVAAILVYEMSPAERLGFPAIAACLMAGGILVMLAAHLWSMAFRVQGRLLEMTVDEAVNSSPLLSSAQRSGLLLPSSRNTAKDEEELRDAA